MSKKTEANHIFVIVEGHPHGIEQFKKDWHMKEVKGGRVKLREIHFFVPTFPSEATEDILPHFGVRTNDTIHSTRKLDGLQFNVEEYPFKRVLMMKFIYALVWLFGRFIGIRPYPFQPKRPKNWKRLVEHKCVNVFPVGMVSDPKVFNTCYRRWDDWI